MHVMSCATSGPYRASYWYTGDKYFIIIHIVIYERHCGQEEWCEYPETGLTLSGSGGHHASQRTVQFFFSQNAAMRFDAAVSYGGLSSIITSQ